MSDDDLDQVFTTACAAMLFAARNWQAFCEFMESEVISRPVPITPETMHRHGLRIGLMANPERMPS